MTTPELTESTETRQRLLEAAGEVFAEAGFQRATIRDICSRAGANLASVNYHFRDKEGLYAEVIRYAHQVAERKNPGGPPPGVNVSPEMRLRFFIRGFLERAIGKDRLAWHGKLMAKEMAEPTGLLDRVVADEISPRARMLEGVLRELLGPAASQQQVEASARSIVGQCIFYHLCRPVIERLHPNQNYEPDDVRELANHIAEFSLAAIRGLAAQNATASPTPNKGNA